MISEPPMLALGPLPQVHVIQLRKKRPKKRIQIIFTLVPKMTFLVSINKSDWENLFYWKLFTFKSQYVVL